MERIQYEIEHDSENKLVTIFMITKSGHDFSYTFDENQTIENIINKMGSISDNLDDSKLR